MNGWIVSAALLAVAVAGGARRRRWDAIGPVIWWREQRLHRRPAHIIGRLAKTLLGATLLVSAFVAGLLLLGVLAAALIIGTALAWAWWRLRCAARASAPHRHPHERDDVDRPDDETGPFIWPPGALPDPPDTEDPCNPRALEW